ncbi:MULTISPECIES: IclR family transcriptional regulator [unclassified Haladaptatus]|uniref:IclR family transcriptional regulator n=1 Tax=unclassified Haladaptatus TaxID=2622732 RepID=UPI0023E7737B|nr:MULTISPECIES: IclR family transcriptional regulator [unclassified Haladaptatus]
MEDTTNEPRKIQSVDRAVELLESIQDHDGATLTEIAEATGLSPGTVHTYLSTLEDHCLVRKDIHEYYLGYRFVLAGEYVKNHNTLYRHGRKVVDNLANKTGESVHLIIEDDGLEVILYESFGKDAVGIEFYIKNRENSDRYLHYSASGKAILAHLPRSEVNNIIDKHGLMAKTPNTITNPDKLAAELETIQERGFAVNQQEAVIGIRAVGAPILDSQRDPIGAISISAPSSRLKRNTFVEEYPEAVMEAANIIEVNVQTGELYRE